MGGRRKRGKEIEGMSEEGRKAKKQKEGEQK